MRSCTIALANEDMYVSSMFSSALVAAHGDRNSCGFLSSSIYGLSIMTATNLSTLEVANAIQPLSIEKTRNLVFHLGTALDDIEGQYNGDARKEKFVEKWLNLDTKASWERLISALQQIEMNVLAAGIESMYVSKADTPAQPVTHSQVYARPPLRRAPGLPPSQVTSPLPRPPPQPPVTPRPPCPAPPPSYPAPQPPPSPPLLQVTPDEELVENVKASIECFENQFSDLMSDTRSVLSKRESRDREFLDKFRDHLLLLPVTKKATHVMFFLKCEDEILDAKNIRKLFAILSRYCNYSNYEIVLVIVKKYGEATLVQRMLDYQKSFENFEAETTIDVYLSAISARPEGKICKEFYRMAMTINKPASVCTLCEIRLLKESIAENASVHSYSVYIESIDSGSVKVVLGVHPSIAELLKEAITRRFVSMHHLKEISMGPNSKAQVYYSFAMCI